MTGRRAFGTVRALPSGRFQARYLAPDGSRRTAPTTFADKTSANRWLTLCEADIARGTWTDDALQQEKLSAYASRWIEQRAGLADRTVAYYQGLLRLHIAPDLGQHELGQLTTTKIRDWHQGLRNRGVGASTVAKAYRLLRTILGTATDDGILLRNPCRIRAAATEHAPERPLLSLESVERLAQAIEPRYRLLVLLAVFGSLRWGELMGLERDDLDEQASTVEVRRAVAEIGNRQFTKTPKSRAGRRRVALPESLWPAIRDHVNRYCEQGAHARLFTGPSGVTPKRSNFSKVWARALRDAGLEGVHIHDLRHTGNHLAAITGASTRELMGRMGHASHQAALLYQHRTSERDAEIARSLEEMLQHRRPVPQLKGTQRARRNSGAD